MLAVGSPQAETKQ